MTTDVEAVEEADRPTARVTTEDATGKAREYRISLSPMELDGGRLLEGKRVDGEHADADRPEGPSSAAWDAAREHFRGRGFEVHES